MPQLSSDYVRLPVCRCHQGCHGNITVKLFNGIDQHGTWTACRPCSLRTTNSALNTSSVAHHRWSAAPATLPHPLSASGSFIVEQQISETLKNREGLIVFIATLTSMAAVSPSTSKAFAHGLPQSRYADCLRRYRSARTLSEVQRLFIDGFGDESGVNAPASFRRAAFSA